MSRKDLGRFWWGVDYGKQGAAVGIETGPDGVPVPSILLTPTYVDDRFVGYATERNDSECKDPDVLGITSRRARNYVLIEDFLALYATRKHIDSAIAWGAMEMWWSVRADEVRRIIAKKWKTAHGLLQHKGRKNQKEAAILLAREEFPGHAWWFNRDDVAEAALIGLLCWRRAHG